MKGEVDTWFYIPGISTKVPLLLKKNSIFDVPKISKNFVN